MSGLSFERMSELPEGMRKLLEEQMERERKRRETGATSSDGSAATFPSEGKALGNGAGGASPSPTKGRRKYRNLPTERLLPNGECVKFASKKEAMRYDALRVEEQAGRIRKLRLQEQVLLQPAYTDGETGERYRGISYFADFTYERMEDGKWVKHVEDTKGGGRRGTATKSYQIKRKLAADQGVYIEEV